MKLSIVITALFSVAVLFTTTSASAFRAYDSQNNPNHFNSGYSTELSQLPTSGSVADQPWSDTYWPHFRGGVSWRWQDFPLPRIPSNPNAYQLLSADELGNATQDKLDHLSPAEKYDIVTGRFDYPLTNSEKRFAVPTTPRWHGYCHAIAAAGTLYREPRLLVQTVRLPNGKEIQIKLFSSDLKALLAYAISSNTEGYMGYTHNWFGDRCDSNTQSPDGACWDTNPASFFVALANHVGLQRKSLVMDIDQAAEVWNSAAASYSANITPDSSISPRAAPGTVRQVRVDLQVQHTVGHEPQRAPIGPKLKTRSYQFTMELDQNGKIVGGEWISQERPDFLWIARAPKYNSTFDYLMRHILPLPGIPYAPNARR